MERIIMETNPFYETSNITTSQEERDHITPHASGLEHHVSVPAIPERPQAIESENLPTIFYPLGGTTLDDVLEALDPEFEDEEEPSESDIISGPEWPFLDEPIEDPDGCYEVGQSAGTATEDDSFTFSGRASTAFKAAMASRNLAPPTALQADGRTHRCDVVGPAGEGNGTYKFSLDGLPHGAFQNFKDGKGWQSWNFEFRPGEVLPPEKMYALKKDTETLRKVRQTEEIEAKKKAQEMAQAIWRRSIPCTEHPYLTRKGIDPNGVRLVSSGFRKGDLVMPILDARGVIHSIQTIDADGGKHFLKNGRKQGCCFPVGKPKSTLFIAEGFATAATIHKATGEAVLVAFDCGNLRPVAEALRAAFPGYPIVIAADDDYRTDGNPGMTKAMAAAEAVGARVVVPDFGPERPEKATDFNDLAQAMGLDTVRESIERGLSEQTSGENTLPEIMVTGRAEHETLCEAFELLTAQRRVFARGEQLVHVSIPHAAVHGRESPYPAILPATPPWMRLELSRVAAFYREGANETAVRSLVPDWVSKLALEMADFPGLQKLHALAETPVLLRDGSIHDTLGFDPSTGIYYVPIGEALPLPEAPTVDDAKAAASALLELVADFPFASDASRAGWLALLLTVPARFAIPGPVPFWLIDANGQSAGKGLLTHLTSIITLGRNPVAMVGSRDPEEFRKNLLCTLMNGTRMAWLDEAESPFGGRQWNGLVTATHFQDRILGASKTWSGPHFTTWVVTGNNVQLTTDTPRRCVHVRLEPSEERPEERGGFKITDILAHARNHQAELFNHLLVILRAYHLAGKPRHDLKPWGSFEDWSNLVRECVFWCTGFDCDTRKELTATADPSREMSAVILEELEKLFPGQRAFLASEVLTAYESKDNQGRWLHAELREALDTLNTNTRGLNSRGLGNLLKTRRDRTFSGLVLKGNTGGKNGMAYRITRVSGETPVQVGPELGVPGPPPAALMALASARPEFEGFGGPGLPGFGGRPNGTGGSGAFGLPGSGEDLL
jgi:putative DNA primase/helicase